MLCAHHSPHPLCNPWCPHTFSSWILSVVNDSIMNLPDIWGSFLISVSSIRDAPLTINSTNFTLTLNALSHPLPWHLASGSLHFSDDYGVHPNFISSLGPPKYILHSAARWLQVRDKSAFLLNVFRGSSSPTGSSPNRAQSKGRPLATSPDLSFILCHTWNLHPASFYSLTMNMFLLPCPGPVPHSLLWDLFSPESLPIGHSFFVQYFHFSFLTYSHLVLTYSPQDTKVFSRI